jgi:hypothetical protein
MNPDEQAAAEREWRQEELRRQRAQAALDRWVESQRPMRKRNERFGASSIRSATGTGAARRGVGNGYLWPRARPLGSPPVCYFTVAVLGIPRLQ